MAARGPRTIKRAQNGLKRVREAITLAERSLFAAKVALLAINADLEKSDGRETRDDPSKRRKRR